MNSARTFIVVGAGQAGGWAVRTLREEGFDGRLVLIGEESHIPYERPPLSKALLLGEAEVDSTHLWPATSYDEWNVELRLGEKVSSIRPAEHRIEIAGGEVLAYDRLLLTTGSRPRMLEVPGADLAGVHTLRVIEDTMAIRDRVPDGGIALVVGGGWIGLEAASALRKLGAGVVVVEAAPQLCGRALTPELGAWMLELHRSHGVDVRLGLGVERFEGAGRLEGAVLGDGSVIDTPLAIVGIGIVPNSELAEAAGLTVENGIVVDGFARTSDPDIFAAGDVTNHLNPRFSRPVRLESWENAQNHAIAAAKAMLDKGEPYADVPWFWSDQYDVNIQLTGLPQDWDATVTRGDPAAGAFITFYLKGGRIDGAVAVNNGRDLRMAKRLMTASKQVSADDLADPDIKLQTLLKG